MGVGGAPTDEADAAEENEAERTARNGGEEAIWSRSEAAVSSSGVRALVLVAGVVRVRARNGSGGGGHGWADKCGGGDGPKAEERRVRLCSALRREARRVRRGGEVRPVATAVLLRRAI